MGFVMLIGVLIGVGVGFTYGGVVFDGSRSTICFVIGIGSLCVTAFLIYYLVRTIRKENQAALEKKLGEQRLLEYKQKQFAEEEGLSKYAAMDYYDYKQRLQGAATMRELSGVLESSVYQEKERDWAVLGGIAEGIAGPAAGVATAIDTMQDNARIRAENAARREWGTKQKQYYQNLASEIERNSSYETLDALKRKYEAVMSWNPDTLFNYIKIDSASTVIDNETGAVTVSVNWSQSDKTVWIDGALRAKLYTITGKCAGCAYLVLPKTGTLDFKGSLSGICAEPIASSGYTVKIEPINLWELASRPYFPHRKNDRLTLEEHRKIVEEYKKKYEAEVAAVA